MLNDGVYGTSIFPPLLCKKVVVPAASVLTLFIIPYTLVTGQPGKVILPDQCFVTKQEGIAYTINGATLNFSWGGVTVWGSFDLTNLNQFINVSIKSSLLISRPFLLGANSVVVPSPTVVNQSLTIHNSIADFTVGTGDLICWVTFRVFDIINIGWL